MSVRFDCLTMNLLTKYSVAVNSWFRGLILSVLVASLFTRKHEFIIDKSNKLTYPNWYSIYPKLGTYKVTSTPSDLHAELLIFEAC